jgi:Uma2 family endonuclease
MAESPEHRILMATLIERLQDHFREKGLRAMASGNTFVYDEEDNPVRRVSPDVYVVLDRDPTEPERYLYWKEGRAPDFVLEATSPGTADEDQRDKKARYAGMGVAEYFLCDPKREYLTPPLQGFRLTAGTYRPIRPDRDGRVRSRRLGVSFVMEGGVLETYDTATGRRLLRREERAAAAEAETLAAAARARESEAKARESEAKAREAEAEAAAERAARAAMEAELRALREELARARSAKDAREGTDR